MLVVKSRVVGSSLNSGRKLNCLYNKEQFSLVRRIGLLVHKYFYFFALNTKCAFVVVAVG